MEINEFRMLMHYFLLKEPSRKRKNPLISIIINLLRHLRRFSKGLLSDVMVEQARKTPLAQNVQLR